MQNKYAFRMSNVDLIGSVRKQDEEDKDKLHLWFLSVLLSIEMIPMQQVYCDRVDQNKRSDIFLSRFNSSEISSACSLNRFRAFELSREIVKESFKELPSVIAKSPSLWHFVGIRLLLNVSRMYIRALCI